MQQRIKAFIYLIESLRPSNIYSKYILLTSLILAYLYVWLGMSVSYPFYENGVYVYYARSIIYDGDLNIFDQVSQQMKWLATSQMYHPDFHAIGLTPILTVGYFLAWLVSGLESSRDWMFYVVTACMNIITVYFTYVSLRRLSKLHNAESTNWCILAAMISPAFILFALTKSTVLDVMLIPLMSESIIALINFKPKDKFKLDIPLYWICMLSLKSSSYHLILAAMFFWILQSGTIRSNGLWAMYLIAHLGFIPELVFDYYRYGEFMLPRGALVHLFNWDISHILNKVVAAYFLPGGMFFTNPNYFFGMVVFFGFIFKNYKTLTTLKVFSGLAIVSLVSFNFFQFLPLPGRSLEIHLPGRLALPLMPFFVIGFCYLDQFLTRPKKYIFLSIQILWSIYYWAGFISQDVIDSHSWITNSLKGFTQYYADFARYLELAVNNQNFKLVHFETLIFSSVICSYLIYLSKNMGIQKTLKFLSAASLIGLVIILVIDRQNYKNNIQTMINNGVFTDVVVGNGREIYFFDYYTDSILEVSKTISEREKKRLPERIENYYLLVEKQLIKSNPHFDNILKNRNVNFGFLIER